MPTLIHNVRVVTPSEILAHGWVFIADGQIQAIGKNSPPQSGIVIDGRGQWLLPGFIDVHVHGAVGIDTMDASVDGLLAMAEFYAKQGVTSFLPTTWTDSPERVLHAMQAVKSAQNQQHSGAQILGTHMEGPYLNVQYCGAQNPDFIRHADHDEMSKLFDLDVIRLLALAPEFPENHWLIEECCRRGITVSVAHSAATYEQVSQAFDMGICHATHSFNAMTGLHHRKPGIVGALLTTGHVNAELIADNIHVHPAVMNLLWKTKGPDRLLLITDAIRAAGMPDGEYSVDDRTMYVKNGECRLEDGTLAGSIITMQTAFRNFINACSLSIEDCWQVTSLNAARSINIAHKKGSIEIGKDADLVLLNNDIEVQMTFVRGETEYQSDDFN